MPTYISMGRRRKDIAFMVDFSKKQAIVRSNTSLIEGIALEDIPKGESGYSPGMVLIKKGWKDLYFLAEHEGWNEDDYFEYAERLMIRQGIFKP